MALRTYRAFTIKRTLVGVPLACIAIYVIMHAMDDHFTSKSIQQNVAAEHVSPELLYRILDGSTTDIGEAHIEPDYPESPGHGASREPKKVIHRISPPEEAKLATSENTRKPGDKRTDTSQNGDQQKTESTVAVHNDEAIDDQKVDASNFMAVQANINRHRRETIRNMCQKYPYVSRGPISVDTLRHIYVNDQHKLLYCFIPKVGCSNWKRVMMILGGNTKNMSDITSEEVHGNNHMERLQNFPPSAQRWRLQSYTKFVYVRNPFVRLLSSFNNKFGDVKQYRYNTYFHQFGKAIMRNFRANATAEELRTGENITFTEFVKHLTQPLRPYFDDHWEEMYKLCSPCKLQYDYVGHLETVDSDSKFMLKKMNLDSIVAYPSRENSHPTNSSEEYERTFRELPQETLQRLWRIYSIDFELFGYSEPDFL